MESALDELQTKRMKVTTSCDGCRRRKVKCSAGQPRCSNCEVAKIECVYSGMGTKRGPPKGYVAVIEDRLHTIENLLSELVLQGKGNRDNIKAESNGSDGSDDDNDGLGIGRHTSFSRLRGHTPSSPALRTNNNPVDIEVLETVGANWDAILDHSNGRSNMLFDDVAPALDSDPPVITGINIFPKPELADHLIELYFTHHHPNYPVLHKRTFYDQLQNPMTPPSTLLMLAIFAVAAPYSSHPALLESDQGQDQFGMPYFEQAVALVDRFLDAPRLTTIQALLLLSTYEYSFGQTSRPWIYQGMAVRMSQSLGLHRCFDNVGRAEAEARRRVFWSVFVQDRLFSAMHGLPLGINDKDCDVDLPSLDSDDVGDERISIVNYREFIRLLQILGAVLSHVYAPAKALPITRDHTALISVFEAELNAWAQNLPPHLKFSSPPQSSVTPAIPSSAYACHIHMVYYFLLILIHRPILQHPDRSALMVMASSLHVCTNAANRIVVLADAILTSTPENCVTFRLTSYCIGLASSIHCMNLSSKDERLSHPAHVHLMTTIRLHKLLLHSGKAEHAAFPSARDLERFIGSVSPHSAASPTLVTSPHAVAQQSLSGHVHASHRPETPMSSFSTPPNKPRRHRPSQGLISQPLPLPTPPPPPPPPYDPQPPDSVMPEADIWKFDWDSLDSSNLPPPAWNLPSYNAFANPLPVNNGPSWPQSPSTSNARWEEFSVGSSLNQNVLPVCSRGRSSQQGNIATLASGAVGGGGGIGGGGGGGIGEGGGGGYEKFGVGGGGGRNCSGDGSRMQQRSGGGGGGVQNEGRLAQQTINGVTNTLRFVVNQTLKRGSDEMGAGNFSRGM